MITKFKKIFNFVKNCFRKVEHVNYRFVEYPCFRELSEPIDFSFMKGKNKMLIILQGVSGSGKSTLARELANTHNAIICSTDDFFMKDGKYEFDAKLIGVNHKKNQEKVLKILESGGNAIVDNTNIHCYEAKPYVQMAKDLNIEIKFIRCEGNWKSTHNVPDYVLERMKKEIEQLTEENCLKSRAPWEK